MAERADAREKTEHTARDSTRYAAGRRTFRRFGCFDMTDVMLAFVIR